ncbi:MAG: hypothetical protein IKF70_01470 [Firmicutes bacterium]|nr:hypothetical protein [Bacillota bacterium]
MEYVVINDELAFPIPDGFHIMDEEERSQLNMLGGAPGTCLSDPARHMIISIGWHKAGRLATMLLNTAEIAKTMEARIKEPMADFDYALLEFVATRIGGKQANGFDYVYETEGIPMFAESLVLKNKKNLYYLHFYCRRANKIDGVEAWSSILSSASWKR